MSKHQANLTSYMTFRYRGTNTERKHREKTQTENTERKHTDRKHTERKHRQKTHRQKTHKEKTYRQKTHREKTHRQKTQRKRKEKTLLNFNRKIGKRSRQNQDPAKSWKSAFFNHFLIRTLIGKSSHQNQISRSETIVSCEASSKFHRTSFQNERFARCFRQFSQKKLPKRSFRARLLRNFTAQARKTTVSRDASDNFHRNSFQNDRFVQGFPEISKNKLPKRSFRARLLRNFTEQARKTSVSRDASDNFHRTKLPKRAFRARLPPNLTEQASKTSFSCEASSKFHKTILPKRTFRAMLPTISTKNLHFATVSCNRPAESYERVHPAKAKCASRYNGVPFKISKCTFYYSGVRQNVWIQRTTSEATCGIQKSAFYHSFGHQTSTKWREGCAGELKICVPPQFWTSDEHETTRGLREDPGRFAFHLSFGRPTSTKWREGCDDDLKNSHFTSVLDVRRARSDERVATTTCKLRISPQFWTSDEHEVTRGLRRRRANFAFHLSFGRPTSTKWREGRVAISKICISPQFRTSDEHEVTRGWSPVLIDQTHPA